MSHGIGAVEFSSIGVAGPALGLAACEMTVGVLGPERVARRMASAAMAEPFGKIGAAVPFLALSFGGPVNAVIEKQELPPGKQRAEVEREDELVVRRLARTGSRVIRYA